MAKKICKKIVGEEAKSQLQAVSFNMGEEKPIASLKKSQLDNYDSLESYKKLRKKRKKIAALRMLIWLLVVFLTPVFVFFAVVIINPNTGHNFFGYTFYVCSSESMRPVFDINDCVIIKRVRSQEEIKVGTDIAFVRQSDGQTVTHRVFAITKNSQGEIEYITKGVNNVTVDNETVEFHNIIGTRVATASFLGQTVMFFRTSVGISVFMLILVSLVVGFYFSFRISDDINAVGNQ